MLVGQTYVAIQNKPHKSSCKLPDSETKQKNVRLLITFFRRTVWLHKS
jgi:hypothetical protein